MKFRVQPPVLSAVDPAALVAAMWAAMRGGEEPRRALERTLAAEFSAHAVIATDSGTSALVMALRLAAGSGGVVAFPGYACVDLAAAARFAGIRVRLYDLDPATLSPDLDSVRAAIGRGVDAIVVAHLFGYPADVTGVIRLAAAEGIPVIEDAAQSAGGRLHGVRLGALGELTVLSFGRGKGISGGAGGALLLRDQWANNAHELLARLPSGVRGWRPLVTSAAQLVLGRPALYGIPSAIPQLRLGEMVYHPAHEPQTMGAGPSRLVMAPLATLEVQVAQRQLTASRMLEALRIQGLESGVTPLVGATPGFLRLPLLVRPDAAPPSTLGVVRPYPRALLDQAELALVLCDDEPDTPGGRLLATQLVAAPTHRFVAPRDITALAAWFGGAGRKM